MRSASSHWLQFFSSHQIEQYIKLWEKPVNENVKNCWLKSAFEIHTDIIFNNYFVGKLYPERVNMSRCTILCMTGMITRLEVYTYDSVLKYISHATMRWIWAEASYPRGTMLKSPRLIVKMHSIPPAWLRWGNRSNLRVDDAQLFPHLLKNIHSFHPQRMLYLFSFCLSCKTIPKSQLDN